MSTANPAVVNALVHAWRTSEAGDGAPLAELVHTAEQAYAVQDAVAAEMGWLGAGVAQHWKSGGLSRSAEMTHAPLPPAGIWASPADASAWPFRHRVIEAEVALRLREPVDAARAATLDRASAQGLIDAMAVSIEVVDSRWRQAFDAAPLLRLADLQSHGALVLGPWVPFAPRDWSAQACRVQIGDQVVTPVGTHTCGDPAWVLPAWLRHATRHGATLPAGTVVTTGTWCGGLPAQAGDTVTVAFDGIGQASVQL